MQTKTESFHKQIDKSPLPKENKKTNCEFADDIVRQIKKDFAERQQMRRPYELSWQLNMNFVMGNQYCAISPRGAIEQEDKYYFWQEKQVFNHIATIVDIALVEPTVLLIPLSFA